MIMKKNLLGRLMTGLLFAVLALVALAPAPAQAQYDLYAMPRVYVLSPPQVLTNGVNLTNGAIDIHGCVGIASVIFSVTNVSNAAQVDYSYLQTSSDTTNWTFLSSCSSATATTVNVTNTLYGSTNLVATNVYLIPGTLTTPVAATAGFAGSPYLVPQPFTNNSVLCTNLGTGTFMIGFDVADASRYVRIIHSPTGGTGTNFFGAAVLIARPSATRWQ